MSKIVKAEPLYLQAFRQLKDDIINLKLKPGERLTDQQLAELLGISRTPVREAVRILCREGLLIYEQGAVRVYEPNIQDICEVYLLRASVESLAASIIASQDKATKEKTLKIFDQIIIKSVDAANKNDFKTMQKLNTEFHNNLIEYSSLNMLNEIYEPINAKMKIFRGISLQKQSHRNISIEEHSELIKHFRNGNVKGCKKLLERHILSAGKRVIKSFKANNELSELQEERLKQVFQYIDANLEG